MSTSVITATRPGPRLGSNRSCGGYGRIDVNDPYATSTLLYPIDFALHFAHIPRP
jgi:hypothetical protein